MPTYFELESPVEQRPGPSFKVSESIVLAYRGWDAYERAHGGPDIVDFDLSTIEGSASFNSRVEVLSALLDLNAQLDGITADEEFLQARLRGSISYLRVLMGQQIAFPDYLKDTLGVEPKPFSDDEVADGRRTVLALLAPFGLTMTVENRARFEKDLLIHNPSAIKEGIVGDKDYWLKRLRATGIPVPRHLPLSVQFTEVDAYWSNWICGSSQKGFTLSINLHARKRYDLGRPLVLCLHEVCGHAVQMAIWRELIARGKLNQACGLTTVHSPEMLVSEGLGQTVPDLLDEGADFTADFHLSRALQYYTLMILHNAHLMIYEGVQIERILAYACDNLPLSDPEVIEVEIRDRGVNPLFRSYQLSYAVGERAIKRIIQGLSTSQKRAFFLELYMRPLTPAQLAEVGRAISS